MKTFLLLFILLWVATGQSAGAGTWTPIVGIPEPPFGIVEEPPALPANWTSDVSGFYYVCPSCANATNVGLGSPVAPLRDIPGNVAGGEVVVLAGGLNGGSFNYSCSKTMPCYFVADSANPPVMSGATTFNGSYVIVDGLHVTLPQGVSGSTLGLGGDHVVFRNGRISGNLASGGGGCEGSFHVFYNNDISDNGDVNASNDQDRHGLKVGGNNIWIIGNRFTRNSGDGVQVGDIGTRASTYNIYIGGNIAHGNKQTGFWVKEAEHVIISQNLAYNHVPSGSSSGEGFGGQYDPRWVWFLFNESRNNTGGIGFKSSNNGGGSNFYVIGNYVHDNSFAEFDPNNAWSISSIFSWNGADITIANNSIDANTGGINLNGNTGSAYIYNNAITGLINNAAQPVNIPDQRDVAFQAANSVDGQGVVDQGVPPPTSKDPYSIFQSQYGLSILVDFDGQPRPVQQWDIGAFESQGPAGPKPNPPVLTIDN